MSGAPPESHEIHLAAFALLGFVAAFAFLGHREVEYLRRWESEHPFTALAQRLNRSPGREWCDDVEAAHRVYASAVVDRFGVAIRALWKERGSAGEPKFSLLNLGPIQLRLSPKAPPGEGFDSTAWGWDEAYGLIARTQADPRGAENLDRWRDLDSTVRFLAEKDYARIVLGKKFLAPSATPHEFRPNPSVERTGERELTVKLDPGPFRDHAPALARLFEGEWQSEGYRVKVLWVEGGAYRLQWHSGNSRSFVNHRLRVMDLANLAWTKTVAHELGHVLGFDDHYYSVWNGRNCYYSQESRLGDLMSNSEHGAVTKRHWEILDQAYPWRGKPRTAPFTYIYGT